MEWRYTCRRKDIIHKYEDGFLSAEFNSLSDNIHKLSHCQVSWNKVSAITLSKSAEVPTILLNKEIVVKPLGFYEVDISSWFFVFLSIIRI